MSCCCRSGGRGEEDEAEANVKIDKEMKVLSKDFHKIAILLLLGAGESGKSTIFKQMKLLQKGFNPAALTFTTQELNAFKTVIFSNILGCMKTMLIECDKMQIDIEEDNREAAEQVRQVRPDPSYWRKEVGECIIQLWQDKGIRKTYESRDALYQLNDSAAYFFDNLPRINGEDYVPSEQDVLRARIRSSGIQEAEFQFNKISFRMLDVGGQRSERRKWIHCFDGVTAVIFCASLSEYDQVLREDNKTNRMAESIELFKDIVNSKWFKDKCILLFLNKTDLLAEKITRSDFSKHFPAYQGDSEDFDAICNFIAKMYTDTVLHDTSVYVHFTCAVNTPNIKDIFDSVQDRIRNVSLKNSDML